MNGTDSFLRFLQGDTSALEELVRAYGDSLTGYAYCFLRDIAAAEDVMEDTFATLIFKRKRFTERSPFEAYLFRIARNKCVDLLRKRKRETPISEIIGFDVPSQEDTEKSALKRKRDEKIFECLQRLPENYRDVLYLTYYRGFSADEVKRAIGKSKKQVYNLLARSKTALKQILVKEGITHEDL